MTCDAFPSKGITCEYRALYVVSNDGKRESNVCERHLVQMIKYKISDRMPVTVAKLSAVTTDKL